MKTECIKADNEFKPVKVVLTFESQKELDAIGVLFNTAPVCEAIKAMGGSVPDTNVFEEAGADIQTRVDEFVDKLENTDYFKYLIH